MADVSAGVIWIFVGIGFVAVFTGAFLLLEWTITIVVIVAIVVAIAGAIMGAIRER